MAIYQCMLTDEEMIELDDLLNELTEVVVVIAEGDYDNIDDAQDVVDEVNDLIQRAGELKSLLFNDLPVPGTLLDKLGEDLGLLAQLADIFHDLGISGTYRLKRRALHMIDILEDSCFEIN